MHYLLPGPMRAFYTRAYLGTDEPEARARLLRDWRVAPLRAAAQRRRVWSHAPGSDQQRSTNRPKRGHK